MKFIITTALMLISLSSFANVFKPTSPLPLPLKDMIMEAIKKEVPCVALYTLKEVKTTVVEDVVDQGIVDYYYTTTITGNYYYDRYHPSPMKIEISTVDYKIDNPRIQRYFVTKSNLSNFFCEE